MKEQFKECSFKLYSETRPEPLLMFNGVRSVPPIEFVSNAADRWTRATFEERES